MKDYAKLIAREWCYPEEHHSLCLELTYHCPNDGRSARVPRVEVREKDSKRMVEVFIGFEAVEFLAALNEACQELLK